MHRVEPSEKDTATDSLEKRFWATADRFRANSELRRLILRTGISPLRVNHMLLEAINCYGISQERRN
jgi:hypothetical protein